MNTMFQRREPVIILFILLFHNYFLSLHCTYNIIHALHALVPNCHHSHAHWSRS